MTNISELTNECLKQISSLTSLKDVLELSSALKRLVTESKSDALWEQFLPSDCYDIIYRSSSSIPYHQLTSKKKVFDYLSQCPILLNKNTVSYALGETSGKVCYMLGSMALTIPWAGCRDGWSWESVPGSRFPVCAVLQKVCQLEIQAKILTTLLSRGTFYGAYFVFKINFDPDRPISGFGSVPVKVSVSVISADRLPRNDRVLETKSVYLEAPRSDEQMEERPRAGELPVFRGDGWMEIEMGRFQVGVNGERVELRMSVKEMEILNWKKGLVICGIEMRPLS